jgi:hypothetical protein
MNKVSGKKVDKLPYTDIHKVADLTYFDGPLLSLFRDAEKCGYLYYWCDSDDMFNRWLVLRISDDQLTKYIKQFSPLYKIILHPIDGELFVVDIDGQGNHCAVLLTHPDQLPADYLPQTDVFFDPATTVFYEQDVITDVISLLLEEVHELRQAKTTYPQYDQRQMSAWFAYIPADKWHNVFKNPESIQTSTMPFYLPVPKLIAYGVPRSSRQ